MDPQSQIVFRYCFISCIPKVLKETCFHQDWPHSPVLPGRSRAADESEWEMELDRMGFNNHWHPQEQRVPERAWGAHRQRPAQLHPGFGRIFPFQRVP